MGVLFVRVPFGGGLVRYGFIILFFTEKSIGKFTN